ncbi:MAG TPA: cytochrome c biogenesis protein CcdA [Thermoplasmata archaeon]|nr:cytochrome c biogenesis protein CcdA [Thermoplasmata archaeon]
MSEPLTVYLPNDTRRSLGLRFLSGLGFLAILALGGYVIFLAFAAGGASLSTYGFLLVAAVAGAGAFFSPCSFPLLPSYFAYAQVVHRDGSYHRSRAILDGFAAGAGVISFNALLGAGFAIAGVGIAQSLLLLAPNPSAVTIALRSVVGVALVALGGVQVANISFHGRLLDRILERLRPRKRPREPRIGLFLYGFAYTLVGIGCTAPFLATVIVVSFAAGGILPALAAFFVFALTMAGLMVFVSLLTSRSSGRFLRGLSARTPTIKRAGGAALVLFGFLLLALTAWPSLLEPLFP